MPPLPVDIVARISRVLDYHQGSQVLEGERPKARNRLSIWRSFDYHTPIRLPTTLIDAAAPMISALRDGLDALHESQLRPPHNLRTLATWLYLAYGRRESKTPAGDVHIHRACPSDGEAYPCELYVAAFRMQDLEAGLYHFSGLDFTLTKLRDGFETLRQIKKGRPDLNFLNDTPAAVFVSTVFSRSSTVLQKRAYRSALRDAGQLVQTLVTAAAGLGIPTLVRQKLNDQTMRELIGLPLDAPYADAEAVQVMVTWADQASADIPVPKGDTSTAPLESIPRMSDATEILTYGSVLAAHEDCVAPGVAARDVRPPLTELSPVPAAFPTTELTIGNDTPGGRTVREVLLSARSSQEMGEGSISRDTFVTLNRLGFRGGSFYPLFPDGPHVGLVRAFWIVQDVTGVDPGVWYYNPMKDTFALLARGEFNADSARLCRDRAAFGLASVVGVLVTSLHKLLHASGPDLYRLAHLEAGVVTQRINLAARSLDLHVESAGDCRDEGMRHFLGLSQTGWEIVGILAVGAPRAGQASPESATRELQSGWRG